MAEKKRETTTEAEIQERATRVAKAWGAARATADAAEGALHGGADVDVVAKLLGAAADQYKAIAKLLKDEYGG